MRLPSFARLGTPATSEILGIAHRDELCAAHARAGTNQRGLRSPGPNLRLVHRRLRHQGSAGGKVSARRAQVTAEHVLLALADIASTSRPGRPAEVYHKRSFLHHPSRYVMRLLFVRRAMVQNPCNNQWCKT